MSAPAARATSVRRTNRNCGKRSSSEFRWPRPARKFVRVSLQAGQALGDHQVGARALVSVVGGSVRVEAGSETVDAEAGCFFSFDADERRSISTESGARILLVLAPWPGEGHYRGDAKKD